MKCEIKYVEENASTIEWISEEYKVNELTPYIFSIHCDGGEEIEELYGNDFEEIALDFFNTLQEGDENTFKLLFTCQFEFDEKNFQISKML